MSKKRSEDVNPRLMLADAPPTFIFKSSIQILVYAAADNSRPFRKRNARTSYRLNFAFWARDTHLAPGEVPKSGVVYLESIVSARSVLRYLTSGTDKVSVLVRPRRDVNEPLSNETSHCHQNNGFRYPLFLLFKMIADPEDVGILCYPSLLSLIEILEIIQNIYVWRI